ncbi:hypothetical protein NQ314_018079 [Rhamnusium bicolor]|uniref:Nuclease HARBI1 n=1 Tax=Rhamnusium bicolor TaxID=1586634 RepID=A0AAV8WRQ7_9CUCU|nr:hypothetical protein NQ314_018079 [Rhamnusium bicolor]
MQTELRIKRKRSKGTGMKEWFRKRKEDSHLKLVNFLRINYTDDYKNYFRMNEDMYNFLLQKVEPLIRKQDTIMRQAISPNEKLAATLRFLATGQTYEELKFVTYISPQTLGRIIPETCLAIFKVIQAEYMKLHVHNYLRRHCKNHYTPSNFMDTEHVETNTVTPGSWRRVGEMLPLQHTQQVVNPNGKEIHDSFVEYFNIKGTVTWREEAVK